MGSLNFVGGNLTENNFCEYIFFVIDELRHTSVNAQIHVNIHENSPKNKPQQQQQQKQKTKEFVFIDGNFVVVLGLTQWSCPLAAVDGLLAIDHQLLEVGLPGRVEQVACL